MDSPHEQQGKGNWKMLKGRIKEAWGSLTDDELDKLEGQQDQLVGHLEKKTGEKRADIQRRLKQLSEETKYGW